MEQWLIPIVSSVLGGLVGGLFTYFGVRLTIKHEDKIKQKEDIKRQYDERPRLEITEFKDIKAVSSKAKFDCDFLLTKYKGARLENNYVLFDYDEKILNLKNLCCVEYKMLNTGKTEIDDICFICNQKEQISLLPLDQIDFYFAHNLPECEIWSNKRLIKPGDSLTIRVCYQKDLIIPFVFSAIVSIHIQDIKGVTWHQPLFCPKGETDNSKKESFRDFKEDRDMKSFIKNVEVILSKR